MPDSTTGGYLQPTTSPPYDAALDAIFQQLIVGLTGLPGNMVRPRWQPTVPKQPEPSVNWCAVGVTVNDADANPFESEAADGLSEKYQRHEDLSVLCSFYGPSGMGNASMFRDGLFVSQNNGTLDQFEMGLHSVGSIIPAPDLVNEQWVRRYDVTARIRRRVVRTYQVLSVLSAQGLIDSDPRTIPFNVSQ